MNSKDYGAIFESLVEQTAEYLVKNNLKAQILGISGGIDSTVVAAICHEVSKRTNIPLIGRSLPTKHNKEDETTTADLVGRAFCTNYKKVSIEQTYKNLAKDLYGSECALGFDEPQPTALTNGNIQARLRMIYLYNLAGMYKGLVMDTDNLTENNLGYFTIHGDVGDFNPIGGLWKTEVFELAKWLISYYQTNAIKTMEKSGLVDYSEWEEAVNVDSVIYAIEESLKLKPTAGLGITNNDLEELGADSYEQVDIILKDILRWKFWNETCSWKEREYPLEDYLKEHKVENIPYVVIERVAVRHFRSEFKRKQLPIKL